MSDGSGRPRLVIAAPGSGHGKTTVTTGLLAALRAGGDTVAPFKVGPDYIDPGYHRLAAGRPGRNLDPVLVGEDPVAALFAHGSQGADISIIEGVMGLFDGRIGPAAEQLAFGSTAHVASLLAAPVVLVVDARGQSHSVAALLHGFRSLRPEVNVVGVIFNHVGSERHDRVLREAAEAVGLTVLGALSRAGEIDIPSRHLGLVPAAEHGEAATEAVRAMAETVRGGVDLDALRRIAMSAPESVAAPWSPRAALPADSEDSAHAPRVAVAGGAAFTFGYTEHVELLRAAGAEVVTFDPLRDERLPERTAGIVLPGGFPEQHVAELSANEPLRTRIHAAVSDGVAVHAECAGLLYLADRLDGYPLCGAVRAEATMSPKLTLGYREAVAATDSILFREGERVHGHEFHRTTLDPAAGHSPAWHWRVDRPVSEGFVHGNVHASYLHTHPVARPDAVARFVKGCSR